MASRRTPSAALFRLRTRVGFCRPLWSGALASGFQAVAGVNAQDVLDPFSSRAGAGSGPQRPFKCACGAVFMLMRLAGKGMKAEAAICSVVVIQTECGCY